MPFFQWIPITPMIILSVFWVGGECHNPKLGEINTQKVKRKTFHNKTWPKCVSHDDA